MVSLINYTHFQVLVQQRQPVDAGEVVVVLPPGPDLALNIVLLLGADDVWAHALVDVALPPGDQLTAKHKTWENNPDTNLKLMLFLAKSQGTFFPNFY